MKIEDFAARYRLKVRRAEDGDHIITGKLGHIYQHDSETLGLMFMPGKPRLWPRARRRLEAVGFVIWQDGDHEGSVLFDPSNRTQARLALKVVGAKRKRSLTPEQRAAKTAILEKARAARLATSVVS